ncbi:MAG TPA: hypothetical protein VKW04_22430, partial [Planctomycetota bacterium]|nr:hypothetical protein [Planctomycetota bacterium]
CGLITLASLAYRCGGCGRRAPGRLLSKGEKRALAMRRLGYVLGSLVMGAGSALLALGVAGRLSL